MTVTRKNEDTRPDSLIDWVKVTHYSQGQILHQGWYDNGVLRISKVSFCNIAIKMKIGDSDLQFKKGVQVSVQVKHDPQTDTEKL